MVLLATSDCHDSPFGSSFARLFRERNNAKHSRRLPILVVFAVAGMGHFARADEILDDVKRMFDVGTKSTASAVAESKRIYESLKRSHAADPRVDYAYAVVLVGQKQYREATTVFTKYLDISGTERHAYFLRMWTQIMLRRYAEALEDAKSFSDRFPGDISGAQNQAKESARALGTLFGYLECVQPTLLKFKPITEAQSHVLSRLGDQYAPMFVEGRGLVADHLSELQSQQEEKQKKRIAMLQSRQKQNKSVAEEAKSAIDAKEETKKITERRVQEIRVRYVQLQSQIYPLATELDRLRRKLARDKSNLKVEEKSRDSNQATIQNLNAEISALETEIRRVDSQLTPLQREAVALEVEAGQQLRTFEQADVASQKNSKRATVAEHQLRREQEKLKSQTKPIDEKIKSLSTYAPFPYEREKERVLNWFSK